MPGVKVTIDRLGCISCAACWTACPEVFEENSDDTMSQVVEQYRLGGDIGRGEVPDGLADCARNGADRCPTSVISVS
jgi:ferredoxin